MTFLCKCKITTFLTLFILIKFLPIANTTYVYNCLLDPGCTQCSPLTNDRCAQCANNYGFNNTDPTYTQCTSCSLSACDNCSSNAFSCDQCALGYGLQYTVVGAMHLIYCSACPSNCTRCQFDHTICTQCSFMPNIGLSSGLCVNCSDLSCNYCTSNASICYQCANDYGVNLTDGICYACNTVDINCDRCWWDLHHCERCLLGYGPYLGNCVTCASINTNCLDCSGDATVCGACITGYGINGSGNCVTCTDLLCADCSTNFMVCVACVQNYGINGTVQCSACSDTNCLNCSGNIFVCMECQPGYGQVAGICSTCNPNCLTCQFNNTGVCTSCPLGQFLNGSTCVQCVSSGSCHRCHNDTTCAQCNIGTYLDPSATACSICRINCTECFYNNSQSAVQCTNCTAGNQLNYNNIPPVCWQICGDAYTTVHICDLMKGVLYDGCTDNCQFQDNFTCFVVTGRSVCSFNGSLEMNFVGFSKSRRNNTFVLQVSVFPPLNVFTRLTDSQLKQIFIINNPNFMVDTVNYDISTHTITFKGQITGVIHQNQDIEIQFNPSVTVKDQFFASIQSTQLIHLSITVYFYSQFTKNFSKILLYISYIYVILGWVSVFISAKLRKLAGLEAMFVLQFSWMTVVELNCQLLLPFQQVWPLRYSAGYNLVIIPDNSIQQLSAPYLSYFNLSQQYFINNYNITPLFLQLSALLFLLITTLKLKLYIKNNTNLGISFKQQQMDTKKQIKQQLQKYIDLNQLAHQLLMCACMVFLNYFSVWHYFCYLWVLVIVKIVEIIRKYQEYQIRQVSRSGQNYIERARQSQCQQINGIQQVINYIQINIRQKYKSTLNKQQSPLELSPSIDVKNITFKQINKNSINSIEHLIEVNIVQEIQNKYEQYKNKLKQIRYRQQKQ